MLSDYERSVLRGFEGRFEAEDPDFADSFDVGHQRLGHNRARTISKWALAVALLLSASLMAMGEVSGGVTLAIATVVSWVVWWCSEPSKPHIDRGTPTD